MINHHSIRYKLLKRTSGSIKRQNKEAENRDRKKRETKKTYIVSSHSHTVRTFPVPERVHIKESEERAWHPPGLFFLYIYPSPSPKGSFIIHKEYLICPQEPQRKERKYITLTLRRVKQLTVKQPRREVEANERL